MTTPTPESVRALDDPTAFAAVSVVEGGGGEWASGADLCVDTLYPADGPYAIPQ